MFTDEILKTKNVITLDVLSADDNKKENAIKL